MVARRRPLLNLTALTERVERLEAVRRRPTAVAPLYRLAEASGAHYLSVAEDGGLVAHVHAGQRAAYGAAERFVIISAGTRAG